MRSLLSGLLVGGLAWYKLSESLPMDGGAMLVPVLLGVAVGALVHQLREEGSDGLRGQKQSPRTGRNRYEGAYAGKAHEK